MSLASMADATLFVLQTEETGKLMVLAVRNNQTVYTLQLMYKAVLVAASGNVVVMDGGEACLCLCRFQLWGLMREIG